MVLKKAYFILYLLMLLLIFPFSSIAQTQGNITVGDTLSASANSSDSWLSPLGDFAFGFSKIENNQFLLSIWYDKIPEKTIVWYANDGKFVESGSKVQLTSGKGLVLTSPSGDELWKSEPVIGTISFAYMNDTGNFMIKDRNARNLWESFDFPTDTILPLQTIERKGFLNSRKMERDFSPGKFRLTLLENGNLVFSTVSFPTTYLDEPYYYQSNTNDETNVSNSGVNLMFNESGYLYIPRGNGEKVMLTEGDVFSSENFYYRATINFDGVFVQYYHPKNSKKDETWSTIKAMPNNICLDMRVDTGSGVCGYNGICTLDTNRRPNCSCPPGYSLLDSNDIFGSCKPDSPLGCEYEGIQIQYNLKKLQNTDWPISDYAILSHFTESQCRDACLDDCLCAVSVFHDNTCWKKKLPLSNGRKDSNERAVSFIKVRKINGNTSIVGDTLSASANSSDSWLSPLGDFAFGFSKIENNQFLLSIWYDKIPEKTIVWYANDGKFVESGSKVQLTSGKGLVLTSPSGDELWKSEPVIGTISFAYMNDTGNFMIKDRNARNLWESFDFPTDTILPLQTIERKGFLNSRKMERDFSPGKFHLTLLENGNLVLSTVSFPTTYLDEPYYYQSNTNDETNVSNSGINLVFNESGNLYIPRGNGEKVMLTEGDIFSSENFYHRATINFDGVFVQYYHPKNSKKDETWSTIKARPNNICLDMRVATGSGVCGYNGICTLGTNQRPNCSCPPGYSLLDSNDIFGSCKPDSPLGCEYEGIQIQYHLKKLQNTDWPISDYAILSPFTESQCRDACLDDCMCAVSVFHDNSCWKKKLPLSNGRIDSNEGAVSFIKVGKINSSVLSNCTMKNDNKDSIIVVGSVLLSTSVLANLVLALALCLGFFMIYKKKRVKNPQVESSLRCFTYKELVEATGGYKEELGRGAFGIVYKGEMKTSCGDFVAVKKLDRMIGDGEKEFRAEVDVIGQTHHKNLVRLFGFCKEGTNRLLVYEYLSNGTLSQFLFESKKPSWKERIDIIFGIAKGLVYLHEECITQIIHCDIKPQNILLDDFHNARISDFGLAKLLDIGQSYTNTGIRGTKGYVAPEWFRNQPITVKVDVYSFGVLLLEIICCRKNVMQGNFEDTTVLTDWVYDCYEVGRLDDVAGDDVEALRDSKRLHRFVMVALWCIQEDAGLRPSMSNVIHMLEDVVDFNLPPCTSPYSYTKSG